MAEKVEALSDEEDGQVQAHQSTVAPKIDKKDVHLASLNLAQKILAIDAKYNSLRLTSYPRLRTQYIRRRNQLLRENASHQEDASIRDEYIRLRAKILHSKYGPLRRHGGGSTLSSAQASRRTSMDSLISPETSLVIPHLQRSARQLRKSGVVPTKSAEASRAMAGNRTLSEHYDFSGMYHIFDQHREAVTTVHFAHNDKTRLACSSKDGTISVYSLHSDPPSLQVTCTGHKGPINDFDWSVANDFLVSVSSDGTCCLWAPSTGRRLRTIPDTSGVQTLCCRFHPTYANFVVIGNSKGQVKLFNVSTGIQIKGGQGKTAGATLSLAFESSGDVFWAGDSKGSIFSFYLNVVDGKLTRSKRIVVSTGNPITCISWRSWISREARDPSLLVNCASNCIFLYRVLSNGEVYVKRKFTNIKHSSQCIRSVFCPVMSFVIGACVVSGGENGMVNFYDVDTGVLFNQLQGHSAPVLDVCWTYDESFLASCDTKGTVILWKREKSQQTNYTPVKHE